MSSKNIKPEEREIIVESGELWDEALEAWDDRLDMDAAMDACELFEQVAEEEEENPNAWAWCARAHYYAGDYQKNSKEKGRLHEAGYRFGKRGIELDKNNIGAQFWTACCLGSFIETVHILKRPKYIPDVVKCLKRTYDLQPGYYYHGLPRFLAQAITRQPILTDKFLRVALPDMTAPKILEVLRAAIDEGPEFVLSIQSIGEVAYHTKKDKKTVKEMLDRLDDVDLDANPNLAPENHMDLPRARETLAALI